LVELTGVYDEVRQDARIAFDYQDFRFHAAKQE